MVGRTVDWFGVTVPQVGFGGMGLSQSYGKADYEQSQGVLRKAIDIGCTLWNTADMYGMGDNEKLIGSVLKDKVTRDKVFLITKFGNRWGPGIDGFKVDCSAEYAESAINASIERLGFTPDAIAAHRIDKTVPIEETVNALEKARKEGKCKFIGLSECSATTLRRANEIARIHFIEVEYSPWTLDMEENHVLETAAELGIIVLAYSPLGRGFLTGRYKSPDDFEEGDFRKYLPRYSKENWDQNYKIVDEFKRISDAKGITPGQLTLAWLMHQGDNIIPIPGTKSEKYLVENFAAAEVKLSEEELKELRTIINANKAIGLRYPEVWMKTLDTE